MRKYIVIIFILLDNYTFAQNIRSSEIISVASNGKGKVVYEDAEGTLSDIHEKLVQILPLRTILKDPVPLSKNSENASLPIFYNSIQLSEPSTIAIINVLGPWQKLEKSSSDYELISPNDKKLTLNYLKNYSYFSPAALTLIIIAAPKDKSIEITDLENYQKDFTPGNYIVVLQHKKSNDYDDLLSDYESALKQLIKEKSRYISNSSSNNPKLLTFSEWLKVFKYILSEEDITASFYKVHDSQEMFIAFGEE